MKIKKISVVDQIFENIKNDIFNNVYKVGEKLPSETELAEMYGVSRASVRTANQRLLLLGLIDIKTGEGSFVKEFNFINLTKEVSEIIANYSMLEYLYEFRTDIELSCAKLAMKRASDKELENLSIIAEEMFFEAKKNNIDEYFEINYKFHYELCKLSKNKLYEFVYSSIKDICILSMKTNVETILKFNKNGFIISAESHIEIAHLIRKRSVKKVIKALDDLINFYANLTNEDL